MDLSHQNSLQEKQTVPGQGFIPVETHPLEPFLPHHARLLMLGSFPPQRKRWSIDFFYPNLINDMWRIMGYLFFSDKNYFVDVAARRFRKELIVDFLNEKGIALYDTACAVRRLQDNASDKYLDVVETTDIGLLLQQLPECRAIATTGQKATDTLLRQFDLKEPAIGNFTEFLFGDREFRLYRMPSTSRAYPIKLEKKAEAYGQMMKETGLL